MRNILLALMITFAAVNSKAAGIDMLIGYSFADELDQDGGDAEAETAFTLGVRYKDEINKGLGWNLGLGLDTIREIKGTSAEFGFFLLESNATLTIDQVHKALYIFVGLNYPLIIYEDKNMGDMDPVFGVQFGTGYDFTDVCGLELAFRTVNFERGTADSNLWGFAVRGYYTFAGL